MSFEYNGPMKISAKVLTDKNGEWVKAALRSDAPGGPTWTISVKKGDLVGYKRGVGVVIGVMTKVEDIVLGAATAASKAAPKGMSADEVKKANEKQAALEKLFTDANAAIEAEQLRRGDQQADDDDRPRSRSARRATSRSARPT